MTAPDEICIKRVPDEIDNDEGIIVAFRNEGQFLYSYDRDEHQHCLVFFFGIDADRVADAVRTYRDSHRGTARPKKNGRPR